MTTEKKTVIYFNTLDEYKGFEVMSTMKLPIHNVAPNQYLVNDETLKLLRANHVKFNTVTKIDA